MPPIVVYDANVLYPSTLRDVLIRISLARLVQAKWTDQILDEVFRNLHVNRPDLNTTRLNRTRQLMNDAIRDVLVTDYEHLIEQVDLPDRNDRHVVAAAIRADADVIVTKNLRDFPPGSLTPWGIDVQHPDSFLSELHETHPGSLHQVVTDVAQAWNNAATVTAVLDRLAVDTPATAELVRQSLSTPRPEQSTRFSEPEPTAPTPGPTNSSNYP